jgi:protein-L-isoaspartate(D-aspartate) O-methyltransferase
MPTAFFREQRRLMVSQQLEARGITDPRVLDAMRTVPRHLFVPESHRAQSYEDCPLPIGHGQTISQPYIVGLMLEALELTGQENVLEVGTGSGYQAALLGLLAHQVYTVEILPELTHRAQELLSELGYENIQVRVANGSIGWKAAAPYNAIIVAAAAPSIPRSLFDQLADGGKLVVPVGDLHAQDLLRVQNQHGKLIRTNLGPCAFVPLVGEEGWKSGIGTS